MGCLLMRAGRPRPADPAEAAAWPPLVGGMDCCCWRGAPMVSMGWPTMTAAAEGAVVAEAAGAGAAEVAGG